jgi:AraC family transcriptional regulator of adaptative response/methylated-DNA-[protein]-cysteine methyltransferase
MKSEREAPDVRWAAVLGRDPTADGRFVYAVRTTGVYCRPSCAARRPRPQNVVFHASPEAAERAGFRACRRCRPDEARAAADREAAAVARICRLIERAEEPPSLEALAERAGLSRFHLLRRFKALTGVTPKAYAFARRAERLRGTLRSGRSVTDALFEAGFGSAAAGYWQADRWLGMTPTAYRAGGAGAAIRFVVGRSSLGRVLVAATERGVCAVLLGDDAGALAADLARRFPRAARAPGGPEMAAVVAAVVRLVEEPAAPARLPLDLRGTAFQLRVWEALTRIPAGRTVSYAELAAAVGAPRGARAVARACAGNPVAVLVPCHRVIRGDGDLSGYRWGIARKRALLAREARPPRG